MTEDEAKAWLADRFGAAAVDTLAPFVSRVIDENVAQNLISPSTVASIWSRHVVDSAQLLTLAPEDWKVWLDVGTGGGFPGMIVALLAPDRRVIMAEPRAKRAAFLVECVATYGLNRALVEQKKVQVVDTLADVISARAVSSTENLLRDALHCASNDTYWLLPRGRSGMDDLGSASAMFHVKQSVTDEQSMILLGQGRPA